jgi:hypothetical protein
MPGIKGFTRKERFLQYLPVRDPGMCWIWQGALKVTGLPYGKFKDEGDRSRPAHCVAFEIFNGRALVPGEKVLHTCDNPPCCNPDHLYSGTDLQNAHDRESRGRSNPRRGEAHHKTHLKAEDVRAIRASTLSQRVIAGQYGIHQQSVSKIKRGIRWGHV